MNHIIISPARLCLAILLLTMPACMSAQKPERPDTVRGWYIGIEGGTAIGMCTFRSFSDRHKRLGIEGGLFLGYRFSRVLSADANIAFGGMKMEACDCCPYWLGDDGGRYFAPVLDGQGVYYEDLTAKVSFQRFGLRLNADILKLLNRYSGTRWRVMLSPQLSAVHTATDVVDRDGHAARGAAAESSQWHLGLGGQLSVGYALSPSVELSLYGGLTHLTGSRYDLMPKHGHQTNLIYDAGLRLVYHLNRSKKN